MDNHSINRTNELDTILQMATSTAVEAGRFLEERWQTPHNIHHKSPGNWVTDDDLAVQKQITSAIQNQFPTHTFLTEEADPTLPQTENPTSWHWIIDPIDGTSNYGRQIPNFCISIAASRANKVEVGVIYDPIRHELFSVAAGQSPCLNGNPIQIAETSQLRDAVGAFDWSHNDALRQPTHDYLTFLIPRVHTIRNIGSAALALAWIAAGRLDFYFNLNIKLWDMAAGQLLVNAAGGLVEKVPPSLQATLPNAPGCFAVVPPLKPYL